MKKIILYSLIALFTFAACESLVTDVELPDADARIVINTFLSPDQDSIHILVTESQGFNSTNSPGWEPPALADADVFITHGSQTHQLDYVSSLKEFSLSTAIQELKEGETYKISVLSADGREAEGECTIPKNKGYNLKLEQVQTVAGEWGDQKVFSVSFKDPSGKGDYYRILCRTIWESTFQPGDTLVTFPWLDGRSEYIDDANLDGSKITVSFEEYDNPGYKLKRFDVYLYLTDRNYYLFHRSIESNQISSENPFVEPSLVFSNVDGGLGVVAGYNLVKSSFTITP